MPIGRLRRLLAGHAAAIPLGIAWLRSQTTGPFAGTVTGRSRKRARANLSGMPDYGFRKAGPSPKWVGGLLNTAQGKGGNLGCGRVPDHRAERVRLGAAPIVWLDWDKISRGDADLKGSVGRAALTAARRIRQRQKPHPACPRDLN